MIIYRRAGHRTVDLIHDRALQRLSPAVNNTLSVSDLSNSILELRQLLSESRRVHLKETDDVLLKILLNILQNCKLTFGYATQHSADSQITIGS